MKKLILTITILTATFCLGYAFSEITRSNESEAEPKRVTGIGGVFFKCKNPREMNAWYQTHLGLNANPYGVMFEWYESPDSIETYDYGKFIHILDLEGNRVELWEAID